LDAKANVELNAGYNFKNFLSPSFPKRIPWPISTACEVDGWAAGNFFFYKARHSDICPLLGAFGAEF
jgi:hypothetical protein